MDAVRIGLAPSTGLLGQIAVAGHVQRDVSLGDLIRAFCRQRFSGRVIEGDFGIVGERGHRLAGGFDVPRHRGQIGNGDQHANQDNEDGQADHQPVGAGPRLGSNSQAMLFFLRHVRYCNLTAIFMPRAYSAESVTGVLDWDHDRAGGIDGDLTVGLHLGGDIVRYGEQRVDDLGLRARS